MRLDSDTLASNASGGGEGSIGRAMSTDVNRDIYVYRGASFEGGHEKEDGPGLVAEDRGIGNERVGMAGSPALSKGAVPYVPLSHCPIVLISGAL